MKNKVPFTWIDWCLSAAIAVLSILLLALLCEPAIRTWLNRPQPGMHVAQQYVAERAGGANVDFAIDYLLYLPPDYNANVRWPLVVFLHGAGERGEDVEQVRRAAVPRLVDADKHRNWGFLLLSPQCPKDCYWRPEQIVELVEQVTKRLSIDRDRIYLTGYSMGGYGTWSTACYDPEHFAAIAPLCGGGNVEQAERLKNLPIWAFHGDKDHVVPLEGDQAMVDAVRKCGGDVRFTIYPGAGHSINDRTYGDGRLFDWLLAHRRKPPPRQNSVIAPKKPDGLGTPANGHDDAVRYGERA